MLDASRRAGQLPGGTPIVLYKNNTDNKGRRTARTRTT